jgi:poly(hydroxyalkanoate) depolymerase family esterase
MSKRRRPSSRRQSLTSSLMSLTRRVMKASTRRMSSALTPTLRKNVPPVGAGTWTLGVAMGAQGVRRFRLYRPPHAKPHENMPLLVMLHGCGQDANAFATSTRMNKVALRERFVVLYPEQDRLANAHGCWNWFDTASGRAQSEAALIMNAIDQVCLLHPVDKGRVAIAGLSAGASMAALLATEHPERFQAVVMHSGVPPGTAHSTLSALGAMRGQRVTKPLAAPMAAPLGLWPPLLVIHGQADLVVAPGNGKACAQVWADALGAEPEPARSVQRGQRYPMSVTDFKRQGRIVVSLAKVEQLAHAWSGGAPNHPFSDPQGPDASRMVWAFAARQFRPGRT